jgi:hypothetical protein
MPVQSSDTPQVRLADQEHLLLTTVHHLVCDGLRTHLMLCQVHDAYSDRVTDLELAQPFTEVLRQDADQVTDTRWWANYLRDLPAVLSRPDSDDLDAYCVREPAKWWRAGSTFGHPKGTALRAARDPDVLTTPRRCGSARARTGRTGRSNASDDRSFRAHPEE